VPQQHEAQQSDLYQALITITTVSVARPLFSQVSSGRYSRVIGADFSSSMLKETARRFKQEGIPQCELLRCDVTQLPIKSDTIDGVHAGAALHCWVQLDEALQEVRKLAVALASMSTNKESFRC
jgi:Methyltransferase domain